MCRAARSQHGRICRALRYQISKVMLECSLWNTTSAETKLRLRAMGLLRERKTVKVPWWVAHMRSKRPGCWRSSVGGGKGGASQNGQVWLRAWIGCNLGQLAVRAESRSRCPGRCRRCRGRPQVSGRDEARNLGLSGVVTGLSSSVDDGGDRVVTANGLAQGAAGSARVQRAGLTGGAGHGFRWARRTPIAGGPSRRTLGLQQRFVAGG